MRVFKTKSPFFKLGLIVVIITTTVFSGCFGAFASSSSLDNPKENIVRLHIRAHSNSAADQLVKYLVRDSVLDFLQKALVGANNKQAALAVLRRERVALTSISNRTLQANGHSYVASTSIGVTHFPTVRYVNFTLQAGYYSALIIKLGAASGNNWWCVLYPPLCYTPRGDSGGGRIEYRSFLWDRISR